MRKATVMDVFVRNIDDQSSFAKTKLNNRMSKLEEEKNWLDYIKEAQVDEQHYLMEQRQMRIHDLRQEYTE